MVEVKGTPFQTDNLTAAQAVKSSQKNYQFDLTLVMLLPLRDSTQKVHSVYLGALSGVGYAECTYADLQNLLIRTTYVFHPTYSFSLWGIR